MEDLTGQTLGSYQVIERSGEGGMATVFKAWQPSMSRHVALKVLPRRYGDAPEFAARFEQEALVLSSLQHPHIVPVFDFGRENGYAFIAMPWLSAGELTQEMNGSPLALRRLLKIMRDVGEALDYAHERGVIHRDVKPSNILRDERGNCLLTDFGIAKLLSQGSDPTGGMIGTPAYMAPEQSMGEALDARSDIYALGVVLYELATGRPPYRAETPLAVVMKHIHEPLPSPRTLNPQISPELEAVILKSLAKKPAERYQRAAELVDALAAVERLDDQKASAPTRLIERAPATLPSFAAIDTPPVPTINFAELDDDSPVIAAAPLLPRPGAPRRSALLPALLIALIGALMAISVWWFSQPTGAKFEPFALNLAPTPNPSAAVQNMAAQSAQEPPPPAPPSNPIDPNAPPPSVTFEQAAGNDPAVPAPPSAPQDGAPGTALAAATEPAQSEAPLRTIRSSYDEFDDARFERKYDPSRWASADETAQADARQGNGVLSIPGKTGEGNALLALASTRVKAAQIQSFEVLARVRDADAEGSAGFSIGRTDDRKWWLSCTVQPLEGSTQAEVQCDSSDGLSVLGEVSDQADFRKLKAEFDLPRARVRLLADDTVLATTYLANAAQLSEAHLHLMLVAWAAEGAQVNAEFDRVAVQLKPID